MDLEMPVRRVAGHPKIAAPRGLVALERGPIVYAFEGADNNVGVFEMVLTDQAEITTEHRNEFPGGATVLKVAQAERALRKENGEVGTENANLTAIPYALWANRGLTPMTVWVAREKTHARVPPKPTLASTAKITTSYHRKEMDPTRLNDQLLPQNAADGFASNFDFWPRKGSAEWVGYEFEAPSRVRSVTVWWFDDTGSGECRLPVSWRILYQTESGEWRPASGAGEYPIRKGDPVSVVFDPVTTKGLRMEVQLPERFSAGLWEWQVD
jgi:hypothetical protein